MSKIKFQTKLGLRPKSTGQSRESTHFNPWISLSLTSFKLNFKCVTILKFKLKIPEKKRFWLYLVKNSGASIGVELFTFFSHASNWPSDKSNPLGPIRWIFSDKVKTLIRLQAFTVFYKIEKYLKGFLKLINWLYIEWFIDETVKIVTHDH